MAIRLRDAYAALGRMNVNLDAIVAEIMGTHVQAPGRTGVIDADLDTLVAQMVGQISASALRTGTIQANLAALVSQMAGTFQAAGGAGDVVWSAEASQLIPKTGVAWNGSTRISNPITAMCPAISQIKASNLASQGGGANGYIYTVDPTTDIPWASVNPSLRVPYVFAFEARPSEGPPIGYQTDFYIDRTNLALDGEDVLPLDHWAQQWLALEWLTDQLPGVIPPRRFKFWYPCRDGHGSCHTGAFILDFVQDSALCLNTPLNANDPVNGSYGLHSAYQADADPAWLNTNYVDLNGFTGYTGGTARFGGLNSGTVIRWNEWVLLKWHFYPSGAAPGGGVYYNLEMWARRYGVPAWTKVMDWRSLTQPCPGSVGNFDWRLIDRPTGHNSLRIPTTVGNASFNPLDPNSDMMMYMSDIMVARSEAALWQYAA